jgi:hypothetical protein
MGLLRMWTEATNNEHMTRCRVVISFTFSEYIVVRRLRRSNANRYVIIIHHHLGLGAAVCDATTNYRWQVPSGSRCGPCVCKALI